MGEQRQASTFAPVGFCGNSSVRPRLQRTECPVPPVGTAQCHWEHGVFTTGYSLKKPQLS